MSHRQAARTVKHVLPQICGIAAGLQLLLLAFAARANDRPQLTRFRHGIVVADHPLASEAGAEILARGGNVVDAAVATSFALSVVRPESCGIGGGGFMLIWNAETKSAVALDYRERAPARASATMFQTVPGQPAPDSRLGGLAAGIPGNVAGLCYALERYGTLDLPTVLAPAIRLAREPFPLDATAIRNQQETAAEVAPLPDGETRFAALRKLYLNDGKPAAAGTRFDSPLEDVLKRIAEQGAAGFYHGEVGRALIEEVTRQGGLWTAEDLQDFRRLVVERKPLELASPQGTVYTMPPPSSGGVALIEALQFLSACEAVQPDPSATAQGPGDAAWVHQVTEAAKHAFADRATFLGDPDFVPVPVDVLTSPDYAQRLAARFEVTRTWPAETYGRKVLPDDGGTSHFSIIDAAGNAVACTETINLGYGSFMVEPRFGVILNNEMDDFTARPGEPNAFGLIQSELNAVAPGKKPLSSMTPTILVKDGRASLAVGASGGPRIISGTLQVLLGVTRFGMTASEAVTAPRWHHQWQPDVLQIENPLHERIAAGMKALGHVTAPTGGVGVVQAAIRDESGLSGASDPRKGGRPAGW